jgi:hypothetical protein
MRTEISPLVRAGLALGAYVAYAVTVGTLAAAASSLCRLSRLLRARLRLRRASQVHCGVTEQCGQYAASFALGVVGRDSDQWLKGELYR